MEMTIFKQMKQWIKTETGTPATFFWLWSVITASFGILSMVLAPVWWNLILGVAVLAALAYFNKKIYDSAKTKKKSSPRGFFTLKKSLNYLAFIQFCFHSIALVLAWSLGSITDSWYYSLYALAVAANCLYLPVFFAFIDKKNQTKHGIMETLKKNGKTVYQPVKLHKGILAGILSWVDALVWAASMVIFIQSLFFQLYQIPTESMVPELYVGTRVFTLKTLTNPEIPLSLVKAPLVVGLNRFDQMVISNPRYSYKKEQILSDFATNFLYMVSFTLIKNPKLDENGQAIADPLIKRTIGMPGEQLMMVDDAVYVKTASESAFKILPGDSKFAYTFSSDRVANSSRIKTKIISPGLKSLMLRWDSEKRAITPEVFAAAVAGYQDFFASIKKTDMPPLLLQQPASGINQTFIFDSARPESVDANAVLAYLLWLRDDPRAFHSLLAEFLNAGAAAPSSMNLWKQSAQKTNLLFKLKFCAALKEILELPGASPSALTELLNFSNLYIGQFYENRNFPPFPSEDAYLPKDQYFFMGDNRYNSYDGRNWTDKGAAIKPLFDGDPYSLRYLSRLSLFSINKSYLRGKALFSVF